MRYTPSNYHGYQRFNLDQRGSTQEKEPVTHGKGQACQSLLSSAKKKDPVAKQRHQHQRWQSPFPLEGARSQTPAIHIEMGIQLEEEKQQRQIPRG